jgi:hypothetical protein
MNFHPVNESFSATISMLSRFLVSSISQGAYNVANTCAYSNESNWVKWAEVTESPHDRPMSYPLSLIKQQAMEKDEIAWLPQSTEGGHRGEASFEYHLEFSTKNSVVETLVITCWQQSSSAAEADFCHMWGFNLQAQLHASPAPRVPVQNHNGQEAQVLLSTP